MSDSTSFSELKALINARVPIIWILTHEERRFLEQVYVEITKDMCIPTYVWSSWLGIAPIDLIARGGKLDVQVPNTPNPTKALEHIAASKAENQGSIYILRDFHTVLQTQEVRILRDMYDKNANDGKIIIITSPVLGYGPGGTKEGLPPTLEKQVAVVEYELPKHEDIIRHTKSMMNSLHNEVEKSGRTTNKKLVYTDMEYEEVARAIRGLTRVEIENSIATCLSLANKLDPGLLLQNKKQIIKRSQILEYIDTSISMDDVGGLDNVKNYLIRYTKAFTKEAKSYGVEPLRAVLLTGIAGTGKSLSAKAIGNLWKLPLLRLDVGRVMGSLVGSSEARMREVIATLESISPAICWLDEVEKALSGTKSSGATDGGTTSRVFGTLLTAMQDGLKDVVIIATANDISALPAEFIRRFNEVFFVDVPGPEERWDILCIHLKHRGRNIKSFEEQKTNILELSQGFTGAEIEKAVKEAIARAFYSNSKDVCSDDLIQSLKDTKPIIQTQAETVKALQDWAKGHARFASSYSEACSKDPEFGEAFRKIKF